MENPIKAIYKWQKDAGNLEHGYSDFLESSFQVEEALEGFNLTVLADTLNINTRGHKEVSREILSLAMAQVGIHPQPEVPEVDRFDKAIDAIVFAIGSMAKLGLTPQQIQKGILAVNHANMQKLGMARDEHGKLIKPPNFVGPEVELQKILDERA